MKLLREIIGYVLGGVLFVVLMPTVMWLASGMPELEHIGAVRASLTGAVVWLWTWQAALVWVLFFAIMLVQVISEERRLRRDFGEEYEAYCRRTRRFYKFK